MTSLSERSGGSDTIVACSVPSRHSSCPYLPSQKPEIYRKVCIMHCSAKSWSGLLNPRPNERSLGCAWRGCTSDVDVFLIMHDTFDLTQVTGEARLIFDHAAA